MPADEGVLSSQNRLAVNCILIVENIEYQP